MLLPGLWQLPMRSWIRKAAREVRDAAFDMINGGAAKRFAVLAVALGLLLLIGIWFMFDVLPDLVVDDQGLAVNERLQRENDARTTGLQALAGVVLAIGGAFTAYSVLSNREDKLDERFARSLELMASKDAHVVSGAVFFFERIAVQSRPDRPAVVDVLCGFLRAQDHDRAPLPEALQALRVLARVAQLHHSPTPDLQGTWWKNAHLEFLELDGATLSESVFELADLQGAKLRGAMLYRASFSHAMLLDTDLSNAKLWHANLASTTLIGTRLEGANLSNADLTDAFFGSAHVAGADFANAQLRNAWLGDTDFSETSLHEANVRGARYEEGARFPGGFDPQERGMISVERRDGRV